MMIQPELDATHTSAGEGAIAGRTYWQLIWKRFKKHRLAAFGFVVLLVLYTVGVLFPEFFAPYGPGQRFEGQNIPPTKLRFIDTEGRFHLRPFVYNLEGKLDLQTWKMKYEPDISQRYPVYFFVRGGEYKVLGLFRTNIHCFGVEEGGKLFLFGTDSLGRDIFSRTIYAMRISLSVGFVGVIISTMLGLFFGGLSGLIGGTVDNVIQRLVEMLMSIPQIPLWMALAAAVPRNWSAIQVYFAITVILSLMGWTGIARVVRSKFISLREEDFVTAARGYNTPDFIIIVRHLIPNFISWIIVHLTLAIPGMILGETALSFLGIGLRPPVVSLGVLLQQAQTFRAVSLHPWKLWPGLFVIIVVLSFNFVGDGLRDAADPYN